MTLAHLVGEEGVVPEAEGELEAARLLPGEAGHAHVSQVRQHLRVTLSHVLAQQVVVGDGRQPEVRDALVCAA